MGTENTFLIKNLREAVTMRPLVEDQRYTHISNGDLGRIENAWIAVLDGKIEEVGSGRLTEKFQTYKTFDAEGGIALPGLVDAHTHPIFAGSRSKEFCQRLDGKTYQEIAAAGGGLLSTVRATRQSTDRELEELLELRMKTFLSHGVTTIEAKSGYGLTVDEELRHLRLLRSVGNRSKMAVYVTCLALHAVPQDEVSADTWSRRCAQDLLPAVAKERLADAVDAFIEVGYFSPTDCEPFFKAARNLGLDIRVHADEFSNAKAAGFAATHSALSADHLQFTSPEGIAAMGAAGVTALLLPGTSLYTGIPYTNARTFIDAHCAVGLATDFNPGSCPVDNLRLILTIGALHCKMTAAEALAAVTWVPAKSLRMQHRKGALTKGMDADILLMPLKSTEDFVADLGRTTPYAVFVGGEKIT